MFLFAVKNMYLMVVLMAAMAVMAAVLFLKSMRVLIL